MSKLDKFVLAYCVIATTILAWMINTSQDRRLEANQAIWKEIHRLDTRIEELNAARSAQILELEERYQRHVNETESHWPGLE